MIFQQLNQQFQLLSNLLIALSDEQFTKKITHLGNSSIGGHTRHIIELFQCTFEGYNLGNIDYFNRIRNLQLENDRLLANFKLQQFIGIMQMADKTLNLRVEQLDEGGKTLQVATTYFREIVYNTEHTIHHLALIKVALFEMKLDIVDDHFGMAYSTIKYQASMANK
ncbi:MAG: hypothetical protein ACOYKE_10540 [Ferruginibacter sp.]